MARTMTRIKVWTVTTHTGSLAFHSEGELHAALEINDPEIIGHVYVTPKVAALIPCYCCGLTLDEGGK
jgi:hypothetical protein